jgi:hypothetical protein
MLNFIVYTNHERFVTEEKEIYTSKRPTVHDKEAENQRAGEGNFGPNYLDYCYLIFKVPAALLQTSPCTIDNSSSNADALVTLEGRFVGVAVLNTKTKTGTEVLKRQWDTYLCAAISISKERIPYTREKAFSKLPEDDEWVNVIVVGIQREKYFRAGVGQVSKWRWENYAKPEMKSILLG